MEKDLVKTNKKLDSLYEYSEKYEPLWVLKKIGINDIDWEKLKYIFFTYAVPFFFGVVNYIISQAFGNIIDKSLLYLIYVVMISISAWFGGITGGLLTVLITVVGNLYIAQYVIGQGISPFLFIQSGVLLINALIISFMISWSRRRDETIFLKEKERIYARTFHEIYEEYTKALNEIKARDQFMTIASHELKTPLTSMLLKLNNMLNNVKNVSLAHFSVPELMRVLQNAQDQVRWLSAMINDLLNVSLMTTGRMSLDRQKMDLVKITKSVKESFSEWLKKEEYSVKIETDGEVMGNWDKTRIEQAVTNLFSNAIKYGKNKPIDILITNKGSTAKFIIRDRGIGISREDQKILFKPFERPKAVQGYKKGLGVGLYLTRMIARSHGGDVRVESHPNRGTTFVMELPVDKKTS
jgi:signal transduction histidine kinase